MNICVLCNKNEANDDGIMCLECSKSLGIINEDIRRNVYSIALASFTSLVSIYAKMPDALQVSGVEIPQRIALTLSPTITFSHAKKYSYFNRLLGAVADVHGDVVECGIGGGESLLFLCSTCADQYPLRKVWGFDSFKGFPKFSPEDDGETNQEVFGDWRETDTGVPLIKVLLDSFAMFGMPKTWTRSNVTIIGGFFDETLGMYTGEGIALLHLDCDLYNSYKTCLEKLYDKVVPGGVIAVDEYAGTMEHLVFPGARKAIDEFMQDKDVQRARDTATGKYLFIKNK